MVSYPFSFSSNLYLANHPPLVRLVAPPGYCVILAVWRRRDKGDPEWSDVFMVIDHSYFYSLTAIWNTLAIVFYVHPSSTIKGRELVDVLFVTLYMSSGVIKTLSTIDVKTVPRHILCL